MLVGSHLLMSVRLHGLTMSVRLCPTDGHADVRDTSKLTEFVLVSVCSIIKDMLCVYYLWLARHARDCAMRD